MASTNAESATTEHFSPNDPHSKKKHELYRTDSSEENIEHHIRTVQQKESPTHQENYQLSDFAYTGIVCLVLFMAIRITNKYLWKRYAKIYNRPAPQLLITLLNILYVFLAATFISVFIFKQSLFSLMTAGSVATLGFAFALQGPILDFFSGIIMDVEGRAKNGDWVRLQDGIVGKIVGHNWRSVTLLTMDDTDIVVPNSKFVQNQFENISREGVFWQTIPVSLDYNIPVKRAERLLIAAMSTADGVFKDNIHVFADKFTEGGIVYNCRYKITNYVNSPLIRHNVMRCITEHLHYYKLGISETLGEYIISHRQNIAPAWEINDHKDLINEILIKTPIIQELEPNSLQFISTQSSIKVFDAGENVCVQDDPGDTMYVILEGFVDIFAHDKETHQHIYVASLGAAAYFGEMALFMGDKRRNTVKARSSLVLLEIKRSTITQIFSQNPEVMDKISQAMLTHLESNQQFIDELQEKIPSPKPPLIKTIYEQILKIFRNT
jgi:potassium efflux system protein